MVIHVDMLDEQSKLTFKRHVNSVTSVYYIHCLNENIVSNGASNTASCSLPF